MGLYDDQAVLRSQSKAWFKVHDALSKADRTGLMYQSGFTGIENAVRLVQRLDDCQMLLSKMLTLSTELYLDGPTPHDTVARWDALRAEAHKLMPLTRAQPVLVKQEGMPSLSDTDLMVLIDVLEAEIKTWNHSLMVGGLVSHLAQIKMDVFKTLKFKLQSELDRRVLATGG